MSLPLPDYNKKINKGDISFVYKGVYHPIQWFGDDPYRPRVETIIIKNGNQIFLRWYEEKGDYDYQYRIPGGSLDNDSTKIKQAENEINEEALLTVKDIYQSPISYFENYPDGFLLKNGDICIAYKGTYTEVFVADYKGKQDKSKIDKHDLDDDMANNGKFHYITNVCESLRPEHIDAILGCPFVNDKTKSSMRIILNRKISPSTIDSKIEYVVEGKVPNPRKHHYNSYMMIELLDNEQPFGVQELSNNITDNIWLATDLHIGDPEDNWKSKKRKITMIINKNVKKDDHLLFLGDMVGHHENVTLDMLKEFTNSLVCKNIYLILGNNDYFTMEQYKSVGFKAVTDKFYYKDYIFTHCALPDVEEGYLNIHGHIHGSKMYYDMDPERHIDVWDDDYVPIRLKDVVKKYESGEYVGVRQDFNLMTSTTESINSSIVPIFTVTTRYNSAFGVTTRTITRSTFNHSALSLYSDLSEMYSYVRNLSGISEKNRKTGFDVETLDYYTYRDDDAVMSVNAVFIGKDDFINLRNRIQKYLSSSNKTSYDYKNLFRVAFGVSIDDSNINENNMICSEFVAKMLAISNVDLPKSANLMLPDDIDNLSKTNSNVINVFTGRIKDYDKKKVDKTIKEISSTLTGSVVVETVNDSELNKITTPEKLSSWMRQNIKYWQHDNSDVETFDEILDSKKGDCYDQVEFEKVMLDRMNIKYSGLFMIEYKDSNWTHGYGTHSLLYYRKNNKFYWFENAWGSHQGIHQYDSLDDMKKDLHNKWEFSNGCDRLLITTLGNVHSGMSHGEYVYECTKKFNKKPTNGVYAKESVVLESNLNMNDFEFIDIKNNEASRYIHGDKYWKKYGQYHMKNSVGEIAISKTDDCLAGYIMVNNKVSGSEGFITPLYVAPKYRNMGLGTKLLEDGINKYGAIDLVVKNDNDVAIHIYKQHGFVIIGKGNEKNSSWMKLKSKLTDEDTVIESIITEGVKLPLKLYHGSVMLYDELRPTAFDFGNSFQKPGWSLYCWTKYEYAIGWAIFCAIKAISYKFPDVHQNGAISPSYAVVDKTTYEFLQNNIDQIDQELLTYYVYTVQTESDYELGLGHSSNTPNCVTIRKDHIKPYKIDKFKLTMDDIRKYCKIVDDDYKVSVKEYGRDKRFLSFLMKYDYMYNRKARIRIMHDIDVGLLAPGDDLAQYIRDNNIELNHVKLKDRILSESVVTEISAFDSNNKVMSNINISTLHKRVIDEHTLRPYLKEFNALNYIDLSEDAKGFIFFDDEENPVAYVNVVNDSEGVYSIQQLQVLPQYKKCGLTSQLIDIAVRELRANKVVVSKRNEELHEEYLREGFRDIDETQFSYTMGRGAVLHESVITESIKDINRQ